MGRAASAIKLGEKKLDHRAEVLESQKDRIWGPSDTRAQVQLQPQSPMVTQLPQTLQ